MTPTPLPDVFLPYQQRLWAAVDAHPVVVVEKSRRTGYTWALGAIAAARAALARAAGGSDVLYMGYEKEMTREFIGYVADWAKAFQLAAGAVEEFVFADPDRPEAAIGAFRIRFASGFEVVALPSVARALRGKQGLVILDEAAFMDDLAEVLKAALALLIWGGKVVVVSTHNGDSSPFNALVQDIRAGRLPYHLERLTFDEALAEGLYRRICFTTGQPWSPEAEAEWRAAILSRYAGNADEELFCIPSASSGSFLPAPLIEARMVAEIPVLRWECRPDFVHWPDHLREAEARAWCERELLPQLQRLDPATPHCFGEDFGRSGDLTVIWPLAIGRDLVRRTPFVAELRNVPFSQQEQVLFYLADRLPRLRAGKLDARGNGQFLAERAMQRYGAARIEQVMLTEAWYREHMPALKAAFEDATIEVPRDREILSDLRALRLVRGVARLPEQRTQAAAGQRHGDAAIAAALAYAASRAEPEEYGYQAAPARGLGLGARGAGAPPTARDEEREDALREGGFGAGRGGLRGRVFA
ncbi:hypothetical protein GCM10010964_18540 [Caldovatus sediminis]|uniref:Mu-like prophage FluMu protein gp28 n=1 Tax=Caldovatus sediminis TaxID=2041189 RepID=A0A8J2ZB23_9PROT|nr:hypothetical protein [Caldovatus sediminis]GGG30900.1 hypothetical protein GCM10010964_18540 [Caldovatus sediminis]